MKLISGNLWDYCGKDHFICCITTNATVKKNGEAVMGRGCAKEAATLCPTLPTLLGLHIVRGKTANGLLYPVKDNIKLCIYSFQVKYNWWEKADLELIRQSAYFLCDVAEFLSDYTFILPKPGCGNGQLDWKDVEPILRFLPDNVWVIDHV